MQKASFFRNENKCLQLRDKKSKQLHSFKTKIKKKINDK